jgi:prefoldin beta subunit
MSKGISKQLENKIQQYQSLQQKMAQLQQQIQMLKNEEAETEKAMKEIEELPDDEECFRSIGRLMVKSTIKETKVKLKDQKEFASTRIGIFEKDLTKTKKQHDDLEAELKAAIESSQG